MLDLVHAIDRARAVLRLRRARRAPARAALLVLALAFAACANRIDASRNIVRHLRFHGVHQISAGALRERIATQPTNYILDLIRLPWEDVQYVDPTTFRRDLERVVRYYQSQGYYSASVQTTQIEPNSPGSRWVDIDVTIREGPRTLVGTLWISGCEPESREDPDEARYRLNEDTCQRIRRQMQLRPGEPFAETALTADRQLAIDLMREQGNASARAGVHVVIDPVHRRAHVVFVLDPGPPARFGDVHVYEEGHDTAVVGGVMPSGLPVEPVLRAMRLNPGDPFTASALSDAQRSVFALGVFGIVRITEHPVRCDSSNRCGADRDRRDLGGWVRVDLDVRLSPTRMFVWRLGGGLETDQSRSNAHLLASFEHRNLNFGPLGRMWRLRVDERPLVFFDSLFGGSSNVSGGSVFPLGNVLGIELRRPEVWRGGSFVLSTQWDLGPDPINPNVAFRDAVRVASGVQHRFSRDVNGAAYLRWTWVNYAGLSPPAWDFLVNTVMDPLYRQQYPREQTYAYFDEQITWDRRDAPLQPRSGTYLAFTAQQAIAPVMGPYSFLRAWFDFRGYLNFGGGLVLAGRLSGGGALSLGDGVDGWPVPPELRFYSGGANSNRGYPYNRAGRLGTGVERQCTPPPPAGQQCTLQPNTTNQLAQPVYDQSLEGARPDQFRITAIGGVVGWDASIELRYYFGSFGLTAFFDASDVRGGGTNTLTNVALTGLDAHPSAGVGVRYLSPIGIIRLDLGFRLDDLGCTAYAAETLRQNRMLDRMQEANRNVPYLFSRPQCDVFGLALPLALNFAIGETY